MGARTFLDLSGCGIGNLVLMLGAYLEMCRMEAWQPVVCTAADLSGVIRTDLFNVVSQRPSLEEGWQEINPSVLCNRLVLAHKLVRAALQEIVLPRSLPEGVGEFQAGFCIRTADATHDDQSTFMNAVAIEAMKAEMLRYDRVFVCSNDAAHLTDLPPNAVVLEPTDPRERNVAGHWDQWHALASCPVIYHGIGGTDGSITSTFGPVAAAFGGGDVVGVNNAGEVLRGVSYTW